MKVSDYIAGFLAKIGIKHVFIVSGGASIHLLHSLAKRNDIRPIYPHHEQAGAMAADAYARVTGKLGCAIGTSGPGATNMITGIAGAWFDSVATIFITGQVATYRMKGNTGVRQIGFQETDILPMVSPITKYSVQISDVSLIAYELEKAVYLAGSGRPGPVVIDIPDNLQRMQIDPDGLRHFDPPEDDDVRSFSSVLLRMIRGCFRKAQRPVLILGWGVRLSGAVDAALALVRRLGVPVLTSWGAKDLIPGDEPLLIGTFGTHGTRAGNFAIQNADFVLSIGARLSTHETGTPLTDWARDATVMVADIDYPELQKFSYFGKAVNYIHADAKCFIESFSAELDEYEPHPVVAAWLDCIRDWKARYPIEDTAGDGIKPYHFVRMLSELLPEDEHIFVDTGCSIAWVMQAFAVRRQRIYHDFNNTAMGWALPAAIGGSFALGERPVTCIVGDGGFMMNMQELATVKRHQLPIRIFLINNGGYSMVQQTEEQWFGGEYHGTSCNDGLAFPDYVSLAEAFGIRYFDFVLDGLDIKSIFKSVIDISGPVLIDVRISAKERVIPQAKFGYPIEDAEPLLPRAEFLSNMITSPLPKSLEPL